MKEGLGVNFIFQNSLFFYFFSCNIPRQRSSSIKLLISIFSMIDLSCRKSIVFWENYHREKAKSRLVESAFCEKLIRGNGKALAKAGFPSTKVEFSTSVYRKYKCLNYHFCPAFANAMLPAVFCLFVLQIV